MRRFVTWFLGFTLVTELLHIMNMLQVTYVQRNVASDEKMLGALRTQYSGWTLMAILVIINLVLFVLLSRTFRKELGQRPLSPHGGGQSKRGSQPPLQT
jgi:hypothetical protein